MTDTNSNDNNLPFSLSIMMRNHVVLDINIRNDVCAGISQLKDSSKTIESVHVRNNSGPGFQDDEDHHAQQDDDDDAELHWSTQLFEVLGSPHLKRLILSFNAYPLSMEDLANAILKSPSLRSLTLSCVLLSGDVSNILV